MKKWHSKNKNKGFTLIEMVIVLFVVGLLMLLIIPNISKQRENAQQKVDTAIVEVVKNQQNLYMLDKNTKEVPSAETLVNEGYLSAQQLEAYQKSGGQ